MRPRIKICGLTRPGDAALAVELGATHIGAVATESSPRYREPEHAREVLAAAAGGATTVVVFRDVPRARALSYAHSARASCVQLYGASTDEIRAFEREGFVVLMVYDMDERTRSLPPLDPPPSEARPALLDVGGGGSGRQFDWSLLGKKAPHATFIAGGVRPDNVRALLERSPWGVDLSSGVESAPGVKDEQRLRALFQEVERWA